MSENPHGRNARASVYALLEARRTLKRSAMPTCVQSPANNDETTIRNAVQEVVRESESLRYTKTLGVKGMSSLDFVQCDWLHRNSGPGYGCARPSYRRISAFLLAGVCTDYTHRQEVEWGCQHSITTVTEICFIVSCYQEDYGNADPGCSHTDVRVSERERRWHSIVESRCFESIKAVIMDAWEIRRE
jgi:hypothetical protein